MKKAQPPQHTLTSHADSAEDFDAWRPAPSSPSGPGATKRYEVTCEHARGGLGRILRAEDAELERPIAIKELLRVDPISEARFRREIRLTARLQHPSIVPLYDCGRWANGTPFYSMKFLEGRPLKELVKECETLDERLALLPNVLAVTDAIAYAHSQGVIHRDLKPSNVIVGEFGETIVVDWGLAKTLASAEAEAPDAALAGADGEVLGDPTLIGSVVGTPAYMAPEQAAGLATDERSDVYALGALLYHVLSGGPPFTGQTSDEVLSQVRSGPPPPLEQRVRGVPQDLLAIVRKAMSHAPVERYRDAGELALDLKRFLTGQLVRAREYSKWTLFKRWVVRNRLRLGVAAAVLVVLGGTLLLSFRRVLAARAVAEQERATALQERASALSSRNRLILLQAKASLEKDPTRAVQWLKSYPADAEDWEQLQAIAADAASRGVSRHLLETGTARSIAYTPDGSRVLTGDREGQVRLWELSTGRLVAQTSLHGTVTYLGFLPGGQRVVMTSEKGEVALWSPGSSDVQHLGPHPGPVYAVSVSRDAARLATGGLSSIRVWDLERAQELARHEVRGSVTALLFTPDAKRLISAQSTGTLHVWSGDAGPPITVQQHQGTINTLDLHPSGRQLVTAGEDRTVRVYDVETGQSRLLGRHDDAVMTMALSPRGDVVATGGKDRAVRIWPLDRGEPFLLGKHAEEIAELRYSPDGRTIAVTGADGELRLWDLHNRESTWLRGHQAWVMGMEFSPDGRYLTTSAADRSTRVWELRQPAVRVLRDHSSALYHVAFSPDGRRLASDAGDTTVRVWDVAEGKSRVLTRHHPVVYGLDFSPDGQWVASAGWDNLARVTHVTTGESRVFSRSAFKVKTVNFSPDGKRLAVGHADGTLRLVNLESGETVELRQHTRDVNQVAFSPDGKTLASAADDGRALLWDLETGMARSLVGHKEEGVNQISFSEDGRHVATGGVDGSVYLWNASTGEQVRAFEGHRGLIASLMFVPGGKELATGSWDGTARVWDLATGKDKRLIGHELRVRRLVVSPDGSQVATGGEDGTVRLWVPETGTVTILRGHTSSVRALAFSRDGRTLASGSEDMTIRLWQPDGARGVPRKPAELRGWLEALTTASPSTLED